MTEPSVERTNDANLELAADIVAAFVGHNTVPMTDLPALIQSVYATLERLGAPEPVAVEKLNPAVPVKRSVSDDFIICLEDGKKFKSLKRHLHTHYNMTPEAYREKWDLPRDYPMVAPAYAAARSALARSMGLGQVRRKTKEPAPPAKKSPSRRKVAVS